MARLMMWNLKSLDARFAGPSSELNLMQYIWWAELVSFIDEQAREFGTIVFGRKTYEGVAA